MELRSRSNLHFIQALKGGLPVKILNVARGRPLLRLKSLKDIFETLDAENGDLLPAIPPTDEFRGLLIDGDRVRDESTSKYTARNITIKTEPEASDSDSSESSDGRYFDLDGFGNMTLKQIKETCHKKKRKRSESVDLNTILETGSPIKQECSELQTEEEHCVLMEPLSNWIKRSKKAKAKTESKPVEICVSAVSKSAIFTIKSETVSSKPELLQFDQNVPTAGFDIRVEVPESETDSSDFQNTTCLVGNTSLCCDNEVDCKEVPNELPITADDYVYGTEFPMSLTKESQICLVNEAWNEDIEYERMEYEDPTPIQIVTASDWDIVEADDTEFTTYEGLDFPLLEYNMQGYTLDSVHPDNFIEAMSSEQDHNFDMSDTISFEEERICHFNTQDQNFDTHDTKSSEGERICNFNTQVQMSDMAVDNVFQFMEPIDGSDPYLSEPDPKEDLSSYLEASASSGRDFGLGSSSGLVSATSDSPMAASVGAERNFSPATDEVTTPVSGGSPHLKQQCPPQRLFQARKIISPASQEKLCKAMKSIELGDEHSSKINRTCKGNLCFGNQTDRMIPGAGGLDQIKRARFSIKMQQNKIPRNEKVNSHPKGIPKVPSGSIGAPRFTTGCTSIRTCSESAIAFSQRQMHDIELLAAKLTNELQTLKKIAEERIHFEASPTPPTSVKHTSNEVRVAIKNVTKVEASAKRLLSMMSRDCTRFCKIMKLAGSDPSEIVANKEKKITFADEAGEKLCHVKFFENDMASFPENDGDQNQELLVS